MRPIKDLIGENQLRALTWKEPYATLMLCGKIETRTWYTDYRGWVLICAAKVSYQKDSVKRISGTQITKINAAFGIDDQFKGSGYNGYAFAVGKLVDCRGMTHKDEGMCFVDYYPDLWCHLYENVQKIDPFQWKGKQGWSIVKPEIIRQIQLL
jgi:hypothetical protein